MVNYIGSTTYRDERFQRAPWYKIIHIIGNYGKTQKKRITLKVILYMYSSRDLDKEKIQKVYSASHIRQQLRIMESKELIKIYREKRELRCELTEWGTHFYTTIAHIEKLPKKHQRLYE